MQLAHVITDTHHNRIRKFVIHNIAQVALATLKEREEARYGDLSGVAVDMDDIIYLLRELWRGFSARSDRVVLPGGDKGLMRSTAGGPLLLVLRISVLRNVDTFACITVRCACYDRMVLPGDDKVVFRSASHQKLTNKPRKTQV